MAPRKQRANSPEFPILDANGLYAGEIRGDGEFFYFYSPPTRFSS